MKDQQELPPGSRSSGPGAPSKFSSSYRVPTASIGIGEKLLKLWKRLSPLPFGRWLFMRILARMVPYSDSVRPRILELSRGYARIEMRDRRKLRNHLGSVHAVALANLGELASGLAMTTVLPTHVRGIVTNLNVDYLRKARGLLVTEASGEVPEITMPIDHFVYADIRDASGEVVARVTVTWRLART